MKTSFSLSLEPIEGLLDDPLEQATLARVWLSLGERMLTRCATTRTGTRDYIKLPLHSLALGLVENWWTLFYEPWRSDTLTVSQMSTHRLDAFTSGYVFPAVAVWSAGAEAITIVTDRVSLDRVQRSTRTSSVELRIAEFFSGRSASKMEDLGRARLTDEGHGRLSVSRLETEGQFFSLIERVVDLVSQESAHDRTLIERWSMLEEAMNDESTRNYCIAAGRFGFDPYSEETPDFLSLSSQLSDESFDDLCDATPFAELAEASSWVSREQECLDQAAEIEIAQFGEWPPLDFGQPAWRSGYQAAKVIRSNLGTENPLWLSKTFFDGSGTRVIKTGPPAIEGLIARDDKKIRSIVVAKTTAQKRFRECRAVYLGWSSQSGGYPLVTTASTYRQQASRAFAAELLCPAEYLREKAGRYGLTTDQVADIAEELDCAATVIKHQAYNHGVPLRGVY